MIQETIYQPGYPRGAFQDTLIGPQGDVIWERPWQHNTILPAMSRVLAALVKGNPKEHRYIGYWAVGVGQHDKKTLAKKDTLATIKDLKDRVLEKAILTEHKSYPDPTKPIVEIAMNFSVDDFNNKPVLLTELGIFASVSKPAANSRANPSKDLLINYYFHEPIEVKAELMLKRRLQLTF